MRRAKIVLCVAIAAVLLVGILVPATADKQTEPYGCKETETYRCLQTETYACKKTEGYPCRKTETYRCLQTETYACKETESYWCSKTRRVYRCHTAEVCTTKTERVCSWNPYLRTNICREVERRVCQPDRRCQWETETYRDRCTREVDATCTREVTGTCTRQVNATCTRQVDGTCEREVIGTCEREVDATCTRIDPHTHSIQCTMPAGASEGGYTSGTMTGVSDYTSTHHDPQIQCSEKKARVNRRLSANPVCSVNGTRMSASDCEELKCGASAASFPATCAQCQGDCKSVSRKCTNYCPATAPTLPSIGDKSNRVGDSIELTLPAASGTAPITYVLTGYPNGLTWSASSRSVIGVIGGTLKTYSYVTYKATNSAGSDTETFDWTVSRAAPTEPAPSRPGTPSATPGETRIVFSWPAASGATSYEYEYKKASGGGATRGSTSSTSTIVTGLDPGTRYDFKVRATNSRGNSAWSKQIRATTKTVPRPSKPGTPGKPSATPGETQIAFSWPAVNGATRYHYTYTATSDRTWTHESTSSTSVTLTGLNPGTVYYFHVSAANAQGKSGWSPRVSATTKKTKKTKKCIDDRKAEEVVHGTITKAACVAIANTTLWGIERIGWECYSGSGSRYDFQRTSCDHGHEKGNVIWCKDSRKSPAHSTAECTYIEHKEKPECVYKGNVYKGKVLAEAGVWTPAECEEKKAESWPMCWLGPDAGYDYDRKEDCSADHLAVPPNRCVTPLSGNITSSAPAKAHCAKVLANQNPDINLYVAGVNSIVSEARKKTVSSTEAGSVDCVWSGAVTIKIGRLLKRDCVSAKNALSDLAVLSIYRPYKWCLKGKYLSLSSPEGKCPDLN